MLENRISEFLIVCTNKGLSRKTINMPRWVIVLVYKALHLLNAQRVPAVAEPFLLAKVVKK